MILQLQLDEGNARATKNNNVIQYLKDELWILDCIPKENIGEAVALLLDNDGDWEVEDQKPETLLAWQAFLRLIDKVEVIKP